MDISLLDVRQNHPAHFSPDLRVTAITGTIAAMTTLRLSFLGPPSITLGAQSINFESRKALALLAYVAARPGAHTRAELAVLLWPESDERRGRGALRYTLATIKSAVGDGWLDVARQHVALRADAPLTVDLHEFLAAHQAARTAHDADAIAHLTRAAVLYRDDFLAGFTLRDSANFDEWQFFQTEEWRQRLVDVLTRLARLHAARQEYGAAIHAAQRLAHLDPLREDVHRDLLALLLASGQATAARRLYDEFAARLEVELGVAPGPAMQELLTTATRQGAAPASQSPASQSPASSSGTDTQRRPAARPHNLTGAPRGFVGRQREQEEIGAHLRDPECRLLTLVGPGGMGKTRLARQVAENLCHAADHHFGDGIYFVALSSVTEQSVLVAAVAGALGVTFSGVKPPLEQLQNSLAARDCLVVLDNFEQLTGVASVLSQLLAAAPSLTLLVTSRARLHLYEEWLYGVGALAVPPDEMDPSATDDRALLAYSAVELFCRRARRTNPRFQLAQARPDVVRICRLVQGLPLALELAAGWTRLLACAEIAEQIEARLDFLATEMRDVPARHRSLRATFAYSWQHLAEDDRGTFARLAVFRGGFDYTAANAVAGATHLALARLIDQTMVQRMQPQTGFSNRLAIHEMLRQYAWDELDAGAQHAVQAAHSRHFAGRLATLGAQRYQAAEADALAQVDADIDNILAGWHWLVHELQTGPAHAEITALMQSAPMLACFLVRRARFGDGEQLFGAAVAAVVQARELAASPLETSDAATRDALELLQARLELCQAEHLLNLSDFTRVAALTDAALPVMRRAGHAVGAAEALWLAGTARVRMGALEVAEQLLAESLGAFRTAGAENASMLAHNALGICFSNQGRYDEARGHYQAFLDLARHADYTRGTANALNNLGSNYARAGDYASALQLYRESYELALATGEQLIIAVGLSNLGSVSRALQNYGDAQDFYRRSLAITRNIGERRWTAANLNGLGLVLVEQGDDKGAAAVLWEGFETAQVINSTPDALDAVTTMATLAQRHDQVDLARDMLCLVAHHPVAMSSARARARQQLAGLGAADQHTADQHSADQCGAANQGTPPQADGVDELAPRIEAFCRRLAGPT